MWGNAGNPKIRRNMFKTFIKNEKGSGSSSGGIGFLGLLTIVFIILKLTGYISWSWAMVLLPLWAIPGLILGGIGAYILVAKVSDMNTDRARKKLGKKKEKERIASDKRDADRFAEIIQDSVTPPEPRNNKRKW